MKNLLYELVSHALGHVLFLVVVALGVTLYFFNSDDYPYKWYVVGGFGVLICLIFLLVRKLPTSKDIGDE